MKVPVVRVTPNEKVAWAESTVYTTVDSVEVARYGMDRSGNFYYQTVNGHVYQKQSGGWVQII